MRHSCLINGYDTLNLTKLDVLDDLEEIKVAVKYLVDGKELPGFPGQSWVLFMKFCWGAYSDTNTANLETLGKVEVSYVKLAGWKTSIAAVSSYEEFPEKCKRYISFIEEYLKIPIEWIGVGPGRESMVKR